MTCTALLIKIGKNAEPPGTYFVPIHENMNIVE